MSTPPSVPKAPRGRHLRARDAILAVAITMFVLVLFEGRSIRHGGEEMRPGWERSLVLSVGRPAGWLSDTLGLAQVKNDLTSWIAPSSDAGSGPGGFGDATAEGSTGPQGAAPVTPDAFDPRSLGEQPPKPRTLRTLLVTGDSLAMPLDSVLARRMAQGGDHVTTVRDPRIGTGISQSQLLDWGRLAHTQVSKRGPEAVVMFMGANEGFPMGSGTRRVTCCGTAWAAEYASRVRLMMATYRQGGVARVYWLNLPGPRDPARQKIARAVDAAIAVAAQPYRAQVRVLDMAGLFTPGGRYRDAMSVGGRSEIVREADGVHLNRSGAELAAGPVLDAIRADFGTVVPR